tara:strand:+ start:186 stop:536 length:351 start_codon:yes stop_codon:yes gene_type:complete
MKIEKDYFIEHGEFREVFSVERIDIENQSGNAYYKTEATYTTLKEALKDFCNQCKKHKNTIFRIEPFNVYWWQDGFYWKYDADLNFDFELGNDDIYISNYCKGWEGHVKKLLRRKQ